jgi:ABC-type uncharacterized transport system ATPase component
MELEVSGATKTYGGSNGEPRFSLEVSGLSLKIPSIVFLMGHNGAGKSVLLKLLAGEERPSHGSVTFSMGKKRWPAETHSSPIVRQNVDQSLALDLSVKENIVLHLKTTNLMEMLRPLQSLKTKIEAVVAGHSELQKKLDQPCRYLSGGQKQALAFLVVSARNLPLLLLDEFLAATDQATSSLLRRLATAYANSTPACVLVASHDISLALEQADRILVLSGGRLIKDLQAGSPEWNETSLWESLVSQG